MKRKTIAYLFTSIIFCLPIFCAPALSDTIYVDDNAPGSNNGTNWYDAYTDFKVALSIAISGDKICVAQGTYKPGTNRTDSFQMKNGVELCGGYAGFDAPDPGARDIELYKTILSGDIGTPADNSDNSYHVVLAGGTDTTAVLDGFIITNGNADGSLPDDCGGGMYNYLSDPTVADCTFKDNNARYFGGGMYNESSNPTLTNCTFEENTADYGGGLHNWDSDPAIANCIFADNEANYGGGMHNWDSDTAVTDCSFTDNTADYSGAGICNWGSNPAVADCNFTNNTADYLGGAMYNGGSDPTVTNCIFIDNTAMLVAGLGCFGGGMYNDSSGPTVTNCTFIDNTADSGGGIYNYDHSSPAVKNCIFWDNSDLQIHNYDATCSPVVTYCDVQGGYPGTGNIDAHPLFITGPLGDYYLSQIAAGQEVQSPCVNTGSGTAAKLGMNIYTTRTDLVFDTGIVDMGCHYPGYVNYLDFGILSSGWLEDNTYTLETNEAAWWKFDEGEGTIAYDSSAFDRHGTLSDPPPTWTAGYINDALDFNGVDNYVEVIGYKGITGTASRTCSAWIKTTQSTVGEIISWGSLDAGGKWSVGVRDNVLSVRVQGGGIFGSTIINDGLWHHVAAIWEPDGDTMLSNTKLYVDGEEEAISDLYDLAINTSASYDVHIGNIGASNYYQGLIDDVRIYDVVLTDNMIRQLYNGLHPGILLCAEYPAADFNGDCLVDINDLRILAQNWLCPN